MGGDDDGGVGGVRRTPMRFIQLYTSPSFRNQRSKLVTPSSDWEQSKGDVSKHKFSPLVGVSYSNVAFFMRGEWQGYEFVRSRDACCGGYISYMGGKSRGGWWWQAMFMWKSLAFCRCVAFAGILAATTRSDFHFFFVIFFVIFFFTVYRMCVHTVACKCGCRLHPSESSIDIMPCRTTDDREIFSPSCLDFA